MINNKSNFGINAKIMPEFFCFLILTLISLIISLVLFFKEFTKFKNEAETKNYYYYISPNSY